MEALLAIALEQRSVGELEKEAIFVRCETSGAPRGDSISPPLIATWKCCTESDEYDRTEPKRFAKTDAARARLHRDCISTTALGIRENRKRIKDDWLARIGASLCQ